MKFMINQLVAAVIVLLSQAAPVSADWQVLDDFSEYPVGQSIHLEGQTDGIAKWYAQELKSFPGDHGWSRVVEEDGRNCLQMTSREQRGDLHAAYTSVHFGQDLTIIGEGSIYLQFKVDGPGEAMLATNDLLPGWDYDGQETGYATSPSYQGLLNYSLQATQVDLLPGSFTARNGDFYNMVSPVLEPDVWYRLCLHIDVPNKRARYLIASDSLSPQVVLNVDQGQWWAFRNPGTRYISNLKFFIAPTLPWDEAEELNVQIDSLAVDPIAFNWTDPFQGFNWPRDSWRYGDADLDHDVDLDDFIILKNQFALINADGPRQAADFDDDGDVDLDDFVILKTNFGRTDVY